MQKPSLLFHQTSHTCPPSRHHSPSLPARRAGGEAAICLLLLLCSLYACSTRPTAVPPSYAETDDSLVMYPDYRAVVVPPNIAPLNFMVCAQECSEFVAAFEAAGQAMVCGARADGKLDIDTLGWRQLLAAARGCDVAVTVFAHRPSGWVRYRPFTFSVAREEIDPYLSYRLIEPGYELYRQLGLYQRNLTTFEQIPIYENNRVFSNTDNHCVNCHNYQAYDTERMLFHVRASHAGTIVTRGSEAHKVGIRHDSILTSGVYPSWHPTLPLVAFSTNKTGQVFHMMHPEKIEVLDEASDLLLYDADANSVCHILRTDDALETFPCWTPDGSRLYYCRAALPASLLAPHEPIDVALKYDSLLYDIWSMPFDAATRTFGAPRLEVDASSSGRSTSVPRISPDGRYLLYTLGDYGQFHIWHKSADLWLKCLAPAPAGVMNEATAADGRHERSQSVLPSVEKPDSTAPSQFCQPWQNCIPPMPLSAANSADADSYHTWSSNGRWIVFASRRDDGNFSRIFISYFDTEGRAHRAFMLPQRDPEHNTLLLKSYNVPELTKHAVRVDAGTLRHVVLHTEAEAASYRQ